MTFDDKQQKAPQGVHRGLPTEGMGCGLHADWIGKSIYELLTHYKKLQGEDLQLEADVKALADAIDYHKVENREKVRGCTNASSSSPPRCSRRPKRPAGAEGHAAVAR
jgi:hypothetical protein